MGQETSRPVSRGANGPSSRRISRYLRRGDGAGDNDGRPHTQEELEAPTPGPHYCAPASDHHLDDNPHLAQGHRLVRAHDSQPEQAPPTTETGKTTGRNRSAKEDRMGSTAMAESPEATSDTTAATSKAPGTPGEEEAAPSALAQVQATTPASATPAPSTYCSAQSLEQSRECILDPAPASSSFPTSPTTTVSPATQSLEQPGERVLDSTSTTGPATAASPAPVAPITTMESLQSALASSHPATSPDSVAPTIAPTVSSSTLPTIPTQQPLAPSSPSSIPRPLPLGTTMIVQGLVQTIEVSRIPSRNATTPTTTNEEPNTAVEETKPLLDKGKEKEAGETNGEEISEPLASGSSTSTPISNTPVTDSNDPDVPSNDTLSDTPASPSNSSTSSDDTPSTSSNGTSAESIAVTSPSPRPTSPRSTSPSSTDVLGLLLSIAAQATAEALVPWSVPPRSRSTPREGIASGLAAAFSALAGAGAGVTTANASSGTGATVPEPLPPQPILRPLRSIRPMDSEPQSSSRLASGSSPRFSRLSLSPGRMSSLSSRRISSIIPGRSTDTGRVVSSPAPRRAPSPTPRRSSSTPVPKPPRRGVLGRIERWVPRRLRRDSQAGPSRRASSPTELPIDESVDFGRAPPPSTLPVSALPESSVSPLPSPPLPAEPPTISVPSLPAPDSSSPISAIPVPPPPPPPVPSTLPSRPPSLSSTPTTDAEELIRFSQMLGFTPGVVHPTGTFERFLSDMQDELRVALGEYQERVRGRSVEGVRENSSAEGNTAGGEENANGDAEGNAAGVEGDDERSRTAALLDHTRPHVPSTDPLPLNWWRMYRFPALPDGTPTRSNSSTPSTAPTSVDGTATPATTTSTTTSPAETPSSTDAESQPIHPAIIIGLRSISRDPTEEPVPSSPSEPESGSRARSSEAGGRVRSSENGERVRSFESDRVRSRSRRLRLGDDEDRRTREGTRNYIIWIIGGYYPSNHPILAHPNLFLGQVHPDELWMLNEFLGQVKPPTATREDIDKAGLRVVKGTEVKELAKSGSVTENCTERCLICLDDYNDDEDLRIMTCKHMFHKDCVDRWMETGRNNCPACRSKGVETTPTPAPESTPTATA